MSEIVTIHVGQCGNRLAGTFWETLFLEHDITYNGAYYGGSDLQLERIDVFFRKDIHGRYIPRAVLVDLEPITLDTLRAGPYGQLFRLENFVFGQSGAGNNWAKGYYTEGAELVDIALDVIRKEAEACNNLQGFILVHSVGGGTGAGMGSLIIKELRKEYPDKIIATFSVFPSPKVSETVVEPYNSVLTIQKLIEHTDLVFCLDNEALYNIAFKSLKLQTPTYAELNAIIADAISGITAPLRFPSQDTNDLATLQDMVNKFVPTENRNLHFLTVGLSPLRSNEVKLPALLTAADAFNQVMQPGNMLVSSTTCGKNLAAASVIFRGMEATMQQIQDQLSAQMPNDLDLNVLKFDIPPTGLKRAATLIKNDLCVREMFQRIADAFAGLFNKKAFLHWYTSEGMDEMEFTEAESVLQNLIIEYNLLMDLEESNDDEYDDE